LLDRLSRKRKLARYGKEDLIKELMPDVSSRKHLIRLIIILLLMTVVIVMLARPRAGTPEKMKGQVRGIEVVIAVDVSNSMNASSTSNEGGMSRLQRSKMIMQKLVDSLRNDKVGLVVFGGKALMQMPMTVDGSSAKLFIDNISTDIMPVQGTNISAAIHQSMRAFSDNDSISKAIILITDAENFEGDAVEATKDAHAKNIQVNVIGIGENAVTIPTNNGQSVMLDDQGEVVRTRFNEEAAVEIAKEGDGVLVKGDDKDAVKDITASLKKLAATDMIKESYGRENEQFPIFAWIAIALLVASVLLLNHKNHWLAKKSFFKRKVKNNNEE